MDIFIIINIFIFLSSNSDDGYGIEEENGDQYDADSEEFQEWVVNNVCTYIG